MEILIKIFPTLLQIWGGILPFMFLGLLIGNYLKQDNFSNKIEVLIRPLTAFAHLSPYCSLPIALCFLDRIIGFTMLKEMYKEGKIKEKELIISTLIAKIIISFYPLTFLLMPLLLSVLGLRYGLQFFVLYFSLFLATSLVGVIWGRLIFRNPHPDKISFNCTASINEQPLNRLQKIKIALTESIRPFIQMGLVFLFFSFLALWLVELGVVESVISRFKLLLDFLGLAPSSTTLLALTTGTLSMLAAIASIGPAFQTGLVNFQQLTVTLLVASFLHNLYEVWSYDLPINISIFGSNLGTLISFITFFTQQVFIFIALALITLLIK